MANDDKRNIIIIGIGNRWRRDDGLGPFVAERIAALELPGVTVHVWEHECTGLPNVWDATDIVYVVDAILGSTPGSIHIFDAVSGRIPAEAFRCSSHDFGVAEAVELARVLGRMPAALKVYGVPGVDFGHGEGMTPQVVDAAMRLVREMSDELTQCT